MEYNVWDPQRPWKLYICVCWKAMDNGKMKKAGARKWGEIKLVASKKKSKANLKTISGKCWRGIIDSLLQLC